MRRGRRTRVQFPPPPPKGGIPGKRESPFRFLDRGSWYAHRFGPCTPRRGARVPRSRHRLVPLRERSGPGKRRLLHAAPVCIDAYQPSRDPNMGHQVANERTTTAVKFGNEAAASGVLATEPVRNTAGLTSRRADVGRLHPCRMGHLSHKSPRRRRPRAAPSSSPAPRPPEIPVGRLFWPGSSSTCFARRAGNLRRGS